MTTSTFPNGDTLVSSALTPDSLATLIQALVAQILGFDPADPTQQSAAFSSVRVGWPEQGQPAWEISEDICIIRADLEDDPYSRVRDGIWGLNNAESLTKQMGFTQVWNAHLTLYGPNCADHARLILSAMADLDWVHDSLAGNSLYLIVGPNRPTYAPEQFQGQWWKRADLSLKFNELVTESTTVSSADGVDVTLLKENGLTTEIKIGSV
jgi:hypothetical protein